MSINELINCFLISSLVRLFILVALAAPSFRSFGQGRSLGGCCICVALVIALGVVFGVVLGLLGDPLQAGVLHCSYFCEAFFRSALLVEYLVIFLKC